MNSLNLQSIIGTWSAALCIAATPALAIDYSEQTISAGITHEYHKPNENGDVHFGGAVAEDFDGDGWVDLFVVNADGQANLLYMNNGDGTFTNEAAARGADGVWESGSASAADYDNDGDVDICVGIPFGDLQLLINDGAGMFTNVALPTPVVEMTMGTSWGDINNDGQLELLLAQWEKNNQGLFMYYNYGGGALSNYSFRTAPFDDERAFAPRFVDLDGDRMQDLVSVCDFGGSQVYKNLGDETFENITGASGVGGSAGGSNDMGFAVGDYDNDGDADLFITSVYNVHLGKSKDGNRLYRNEGNFVFSNVTVAAGVDHGFWGWGTVFGDVDNDGYLDLFEVNGMNASFADCDYNGDPARLWRNRGDGTFTNLAAEAGVDNTGQGRGTLMFDYDNDGDLDIFLVNNEDMGCTGDVQGPFNPGPPALYRNDTTNTHHWLKVGLRGEAPFHSHGIGARILADVDDGTNSMTLLRDVNAGTHYLAQSPASVVHFGLGAATQVDELLVQWPTGEDTKLYDIACNQFISIPSPMATFSTEYVQVGQTFTADVGVTSNMLEWVINGVTNPHPLSVVFTNAVEEQEVTLNVYDAGGSTLLRKESYEVTVLPEVVFETLLMPQGTNMLFSFSGESGVVYQVQRCDVLGTNWSDYGSVWTNDGTDQWIGGVSNEAAGSYFRILRYMDE